MPSPRSNPGRLTYFKEEKFMEKQQRYSAWKIELAKISTGDYDTDSLLKIYGTETPAVEDADIKVINFGMFNSYSVYAAMVDGKLLPLITANLMARRTGKPEVKPDYKINYDYGIYRSMPDIEKCICDGFMAGITQSEVDLGIRFGRQLGTSRYCLNCVSWPVCFNRKSPIGNFDNVLQKCDMYETDDESK
jgi:hypothetical protein